MVFKYFKIAVLLLFFISLTSVKAQIKYLDAIYEKINQKTHKYFSKEDHDLFLDIYFAEDDKVADKPLLVYVHGGGFSGGVRNDDRTDQFLREMAKKGYVTATIDYTLVMKGKSFSCEQPAPNKIETFKVVGQDISRAVRYLIQNKDKWRVDTTKIVLIGSSAGAEAALHAVFWDLTKKDVSHILPEEFRYAGVISMAGALTNVDLITERSAIPVQLFHGTCDNLVPYGTASHHYCELGDPGYLVLSGPDAIVEKLRELGKPYYLFSDCGGGHEWASKPMFDYKDIITDFLYNDVMMDQKRQITLVEGTGNRKCPEYFSLKLCEE